MMMDDERHRREYNEAREYCLLKTKGMKCSIKFKTPKALGLVDCHEDEWTTCPLFVFIKKVPGKHGHI